LHHLHGLSAAVYTQTTDVETECNGLLSYDRAVAKLDPQVLAQANAVGRGQTPGRVIVPDAISANVILELHFPGTRDRTGSSPVTTPPDGRKAWRLRHALTRPERWSTRFGTRTTSGCGGSLRLGPRTCAVSNWKRTTTKTWKVYLNGVLAAELPGFIEHYEQFDLRPEAVATLKPGVNTLAVHCHQTTGGQYVDVGLIVPDEPTAPTQ
jgi:hypothetical protein